MLKRENEKTIKERQQGYGRGMKKEQPEKETRI